MVMYCSHAFTYNLHEWHSERKKDKVTQHDTTRHDTTQCLFHSTVYIVGTVLLEALVVVIVYLIYAIVSAFLRRRVTPPPVPAHIRLQPTLPGFLVFVGRTMSAAVLVMRDNVRSWFQSPRIARVMRVPAREVPGGGGGEVDVHFIR